MRAAGRQRVPQVRTSYISAAGIGCTNLGVYFRFDLHGSAERNPTPSERIRQPSLNLQKTHYLAASAFLKNPHADKNNSEYQEAAA